MPLVLVFVYFAFIKFDPFSLALGARGWLRLVLVAFPGLFYERFCLEKLMLRKNDITVYYSELVVNPAFQYSDGISKGASPDGTVDDRKKIRQIWNS